MLTAIKLAQSHNDEAFSEKANGSEIKDLKMCRIDEKSTLSDIKNRIFSHQ